LNFGVATHAGTNLLHLATAHIVDADDEAFRIFVQILLYTTRGMKAVQTHVTHQQLDEVLGLPGAAITHFFSVFLGHRNTCDQGLPQSVI
jgi:hypothetical protein